MQPHHGKTHRIGAGGTAGHSLPWAVSRGPWASHAPNRHDMMLPGWWIMPMCLLGLCFWVVVGLCLF